MQIDETVPEVLKNGIQNSNFGDLGGGVHEIHLNSMFNKTFTQTAGFYNI